MFMDQLGIYGWREADENLLLASLLTGDPLLLIGNHGCAKTHVGYKFAEALGLRYLAYDASKCMFEDVLGYPNVERLKRGVVEYVSSPVTVWDKELILIDELNRAVPELQSKWLEIIRSRRIMGFTTQVKWVWAAMNPLSYSATNALDEALIGRFATFLYPPTALDMSEEDRARVAEHVNGDDAPGLETWIGSTEVKSVQESSTKELGQTLRTTLELAGARFLTLKGQMTTLPEFLARFAELLLGESSGKIALDGRRLGFIYRNLLANRAIELAKTEVRGTNLPEFVTSARRVVQHSIPAGLDDEGLSRDEAAHAIEIAFYLLGDYFDDDAELVQVNFVYELFTTKDVMRKAELLLNHNLSEFARSKAWTDLMKEENDLTLLAYTALQVEAHRPGTVPKELLRSLSERIKPDHLKPACIPFLQGDAVEYVDEVEALLQEESDLSRLVAIQHVAKLAGNGPVTPETIRETRQHIEADVKRFGALCAGLEGGPVA